MRHLVASIAKRAEVWSSHLLFAIGALALVSNLYVAIAHLSDRYHVSHASGTWLALTWSAQETFFYPPLFDAGFYGGTRYAPLSRSSGTSSSRR